MELQSKTQTQIYQAVRWTGTNIEEMMELCLERAKAWKHVKAPVLSEAEDPVIEWQVQVFAQMKGRSDGIRPILKEDDIVVRDPSGILHIYDEESLNEEFDVYTSPEGAGVIDSENLAG